jgi:hypothetical protein
MAGEWLSKGWFWGHGNLEIRGHHTKFSSNLSSQAQENKDVSPEFFYEKMKSSSTDKALQPARQDRAAKRYVMRRERSASTTNCSVWIVSLATT